MSFLDARDERPASPLPEDDCWRLLSGQEVGRVAMQTPGGLIVFPVNFAVLDGRIVFRTSEHGMLGAAASYGRPVAFQVDSLDRMARYGWTVLARGELRRADAATTAAAQEAVDTWPQRENPVVAVVVVDEIAGRVLPW